jgi:putative addiction module killer protein
MKAQVYEDERGKRPFEDWFNSLPSDYAVKVQATIGKLEAGHKSGLKSVGKVQEWKIDWGPGIRVYVNFDGTKIVLLLGGGTKTRQSDDIEKAEARWADYLKRKKAATKTKKTAGTTTKPTKKKAKGK